MTDPDLDPGLDPGSDTPIRSRIDFQRRVRAAFAEAADAGCRELWLADADFAAWPLGESAVVADLTRWVDSRRRLHLVAATFDELARLHPRWVAWRRDWSHVVFCRSNTERPAGEMPTLMLAPGRFCLQLADRSAFRGRLSRAPSEQLRCREWLDAVLQQSAEAFPSRVTGL